jgi:hypothetical protein
MEEEKNEKGFVIKDRRLFDESGEVRTDTEKKVEEKAAATAGVDEANDPIQEVDDHEESDGPVPPINFASFIYSIATTAFYHFGDFPDPATNKKSRNLAAAKQTIDILSMLREKTEGNLLTEEKKMLDDILYELRMRFVKEAETR